MNSGTFPTLLTHKKGRVLLLLMVLGSLFFVPGLGRVHLFDWDEANFAEAAREMLERGDWLRVTIDYQPFYQKPPLFFWLQALSMKVWGVNEFAARFVNAVCGIATLAIVFTLGSRLFGTLFGLLWVMTFLGSFLPHLFFKSGVIDPVFNLLIFSGLAVFTSGTGTPRRGLYALSGLLIGLAVLAKGPVAMLIVCLTVFICWATVRFRKLFSLSNAVVFLACTAAVSLVFFGVETAAHGTDFIRNFISYQFTLLTTGESGHGGPVYYHLLALLLGCFPASLFAACAFTKRAGDDDRQRTFSRLMIALFWVVVVVFSIVKTKTVLYSSLAYFPLTCLAALFLWDVMQGKRTIGKPLLIVLSVFSLLVCAVLTAFPVIMMHKELIIPLVKDRFAAACLENPVQWSGFEFLLGIGYAVAVAGSILLLAKRRILAGAAGLFGSSAACLFLFMFIFAPKIEQYSQGGPVAFYKEHAGGDAYARALFKSYVDLFYVRKKAGAHPSSHDREWLLRGRIDRPAYFVSKVTQSAPYDDPALGLTKLKSEYGFVYYKRDVPGN